MKVSEEDNIILMTIKAIPDKIFTAVNLLILSKSSNKCDTICIQIPIAYLIETS